MSSIRVQSALCHGQHLRIAGKQIGRRRFSNSTALQRYGPVPKFTEVSNPELQSFLETVRNKCVMPAHLAASQQALIYKQSKRKQLEAEPVIVNLSGEEFILEHINRSKDVPSKHAALRTAAKLMEEKDWGNLPNLMRGLKNAGFNATSAKSLVQLKYVVRKAGAAGRMDVILECARRAPNTGIVLRDIELVRQILFQLHLKALERDGNLIDITKTLSWAQQFAALMEDPQHAGDLNPKSLENPRSSPLVIGLLLNIAALKSSQYCDGKDEDGKVLEYATKLLGSSQPLKVLAPEERQSLSSPPRALTSEEYHLMDSIREILPVLHGMKIALAILDPTSTVAESLKQQVGIVEPQLLAQRKALSQLVQERGGKSETLVYYDKIMGSEVS